jgi:hypothetical protein
MVSLMSLWLPVLLSAVAAFFASFVIHMLLKYHQNNFSKLDSEDAVRDALRPFDIAPGEYAIPRTTHENMKQPEHMAKYEQGPVVIMTVWPNAAPNMTKNLALWFGYCLLAGLLAAYLAGRTLGPGAGYLSVFQVTGTAAFLAYSLALLQDSIWFGRKWSTTGKFVFDGLVYALLTGAIFAWLWPGV